MSFISRSAAAVAPINSGWIEHNGHGRPVPVGTLVDVVRFNGSVEENVIAGRSRTADRFGDTLPPSRGRWSAWDHYDGGPMGVKFCAYRVRQETERFSAQMTALRSLLTIREEEFA